MDGRGRAGDECEIRDFGEADGIWRVRTAELRSLNLLPSPLPAMAAQATFLRGGMVRSVWMHHCVADGAGLTRFYGVWSENKRLGTGSLDTEKQDKNGASVAYALDA